MSSFGGTKIGGKGMDGNLRGTGGGSGGSAERRVSSGYSLTSSEGYFRDKLCWWKFGSRYMLCGDV